jgi:hypothetical protein
VSVLLLEAHIRRDSSGSAPCRDCAEHGQEISLLVTSLLLELLFDTSLLRYLRIPGQTRVTHGVCATFSNGNFPWTLTRDPGACGSTTDKEQHLLSSDDILGIVNMLQALMV